MHRKRIRSSRWRLRRHHDLPTLRGLLGERGSNAGQNPGAVSDEVVLRGLYQDRELAKQGLLDALHKYGCLPKRAGHKASLMSMTPTLNRGLQRYIADSNSALLGLQPEDWLDMAEPVNIPGTSYQYKNWRRKLSATLESMFADDGVNKLLKDLDRRRRAAAKKK
ncbi:4-alpha-glucanotransferase [Escherichia coli]|uniref:4-alpha-glucanotransferase n=1 Tax=Escherichia coli TaxID=562 RepID=A0A376NWN2_ECOLX|nr:4-alpha-glucanotransferase [Escherichia coli]